MNILLIGAFFVNKALFILDRDATEKANEERKIDIKGETIILVGDSPDGTSKYQDLSTYVEEVPEGFELPNTAKAGDGEPLPPSVMDAPTGPTDQSMIPGPEESSSSENPNAEEFVEAVKEISPVSKASASIKPKGETTKKRERKPPVKDPKPMSNGTSMKQAK